MPSWASLTSALVLPLLAILALLVVKAWPALSWEFLTQNPQSYMTAGGIWAPLVGTFYLVFISLAVAAPIGVLAGVYLNEYAGDHWGTRIVNMAVVNLAGVPSIVHALFGVGAFVLFAGMGRSVLAAALHAGDHDAAGDHHQHPGGAGGGAAVVPGSVLEHGRQPLADHPHDRPAERHQRHPDGRDPPGVARGG